jgi:CheY-like chemotaxis protein
MQLSQQKPEQQTIVIVEDDNGNATMLEMVLSMGTEYISYLYSNGVELLASLDEIKQSHLALFFVNYFRPDINGLSLCRLLHEIEEFKERPTILVSASTDDLLTKEA